MKRTKTKDSDLVVYPNGTIYFVRGRKEISLRTKSFKEAVQKKRLLEPRIEGLLKMPLKLKIGDVIDVYLAEREKEVEAGELRPVSFRDVVGVFRRYLTPFFGNLRFANLDQDEWESFKKKYAPLDLANSRKHFGHFLKWSKKKGFITDLPILDLDKRRRRKRRILKPQEMKMIWQECRGSLRIFISMALFMGMRRTEIMTLRWSDINFQEKFIHLGDDRVKTGEGRFVPMAEEVLRLLTERFQDQKAEKLETIWVFPNLLDPKRAADPSGLKTAWHTVKRRAFGVKPSGELEDITWHDLRATCEKFAHQRTDLTPTQLEKFFGANIDIQRRRYVTFDADDVRGVEKSIDGVLSAPFLAEKS